MAVIEVVDKAGVGEEGQKVVHQVVSNVLRKLASDAVYLKTVRATIVKSVSEELESRRTPSGIARTENIKTIVVPSDPRTVEMLIPERRITAEEPWRVEGAIAHEIAEVRLLVEEEFAWRAFGKLKIFAPYIAALIEDAVRERLADVKVCLNGYSGYVYEAFLEDIPLIASEMGRSVQVDTTMLKLIMLRGDRSLSLYFSGQKLLAEHSYNRLYTALEEQKTSFPRIYDDFRRKILLSGEISPFVVEQALV